jgi:glycosyltransferase involved in cell wall biosynthesis
MAATVPVTIRAFLLPLAAYFRGRGWRVDAAAQGATACERTMAAFDRVWDVEWSRNPLDPRNLVRAPGAFRALVDREGYDIVHVHTHVAAFAGRLALRACRRRGAVSVIYTAHGFSFFPGGPLFRNAMFLGLERLAGRWTDYLVTMNGDDQRAVDRYRIVPPARGRYMPGIGVDADHYSPASVNDSQVAEVRRSLGIPPEAAVFTMIAEFIARKRHRDALLAFARLPSAGAAAPHLVLAGTGPLLERTRALAQSLGIAGRVHFVGFRDDVPVLVCSSRAVLLVSAQEGLPRSVMEALCLEVPVIATRVRGTDELVAQSGGGLLADVGDVDGIADALAWMLAHPEESAAMGRHGRAAMAAYDVRSIIALHEALYAEALAGRDAQWAGPSQDTEPLLLGEPC